MFLNIDINSHLFNKGLGVAPPYSAGAIINQSGWGGACWWYGWWCQLITIAKDPETHLGNEKNPGCLGYIGDYTTQYIGIIVNQYKDPYKPTSIMESSKGFFRGSPEYQSLLVSFAQGRHAAAHLTLQDAANIAFRNTCGGRTSPMPWECLVTGLRWVFGLAPKKTAGNKLNHYSWSLM